MSFTNSGPAAQNEVVRGQQSGLGIGSLVCGIVGIVGAIVLAAVGIALGVIGLVLGLVARRSPAQNSRLTTAGIVTSAIALVVGVANSILGALLLSGNL